MGGNHITKQEKLVIEIKKTDHRKKKGKKKCFIEVHSNLLVLH